jgi:uncharacterized membrane protein
VNTLVLILRLVHIVAGVFWVGSAILSAFFITPAVAATADAGTAVMNYLMTKARLSTRISAASGLAVAAGAALYWIDSQGLTSPWQYSGPGIGFGIGGLLALIGMGLGLMVGSSAKRLGQLAAQSQGRPSAEQAAQMQAAQKRMASLGAGSTIALVLSLACMATARYWLF